MPSLLKLPFALLVAAPIAIYSCRSLQSESEGKSVFQVSKDQVEVVYDFSECMARKVVPDINAAYNMAFDKVSEQIEAKVNKDPKLKEEAKNNLAFYRNQIDFNDVVAKTSKYVADHKVDIYGATNFQLASLVPNGFVFAFHHPVLETLEKAAIDAVTKNMKAPISVVLFPYIGIVMVPTCYHTVGEDGKIPDSPPIFRYKFGGTFIGIWRVKANSPGTTATESDSPTAAVAAAPNAAPGVTIGSGAWHAMFGLVWGSLYEPNQLRGPLLGFGGSWARKPNPNGTSLPNVTTDLASKTGGKIGVVFRPMAMWGYRDPRDSKKWSLREMFNSLIGNAFSGVPTHLTLFFDFVGGETQKGYANTYAGFQITSSEIIDGFLDRPLIVDSQAGSNGEMKANPRLDQTE